LKLARIVLALYDRIWALKMDGLGITFLASEELLEVRSELFSQSSFLWRDDRGVEIALEETLSELKIALHLFRSREDCIVML
jgi:hypothetical protein